MGKNILKYHLVICHLTNLRIKKIHSEDITKLLCSLRTRQRFNNCIYSKNIFLNYQKKHFFVSTIKTLKDIIKNDDTIMVEYRGL